MPTPTIATLIDPSFSWRDHKKSAPAMLVVAEVTTNTSGIWTLDISSFGFKSITSLSTQALSTGTAIANQNIATVTAVSNTAISGAVVSQVTVLVGGNTLQFVNVATHVYVQVWGNPIN